MECYMFYTFGYSMKNLDSAILINNSTKDIYAPQPLKSSDIPSGSNLLPGLNSLKGEDVMPSTVYHNINSYYVLSTYSVGEQFNTLLLDHHHNLRR